MVHCQDEFHRINGVVVTWVVAIDPPGVRFPLNAGLIFSSFSLMRVNAFTVLKYFKLHAAYIYYIVIHRSLLDIAMRNKENDVV